MNVRTKEEVMEMIKNRFQRLKVFLGAAVDVNDYDLGIFPLSDDRFEALKELEALRQYVMALIVDDMEAVGLRFAPIALRIRARRVFKEIERQNRIVQQGFRLYMGGGFDTVADHEKIMEIARRSDARRPKHVYVQGPGPDMVSLRDGRAYTEHERIRYGIRDTDCIPL